MKKMLLVLAVILISGCDREERLEHWLDGSWELYYKGRNMIPVETGSTDVWEFHHKTNLLRQKLYSGSMTYNVRHSKGKEYMMKVWSNGGGGVQWEYKVMKIDKKRFKMSDREGYVYKFRKF